MTKEIMINCPNANLKNYIFKLHHENAELKKCFHLNRRETECLYRIESLLNKMRIKKINNKNFYDNAILLQQEEQTLLNKVFSEYYKQLKTEQLSNQDRVMEPYFEEAITKLINLGKKLKVIINV